MEQIYKGIGMISPEMSRKEIEIIKQGATSFPLKLAKRQERWGIWMKISDALLLVNPIALVNTLFVDGEQYGFFQSYDDDKADKFSFRTDRRTYSVEVSLGHPLIEKKSSRVFMYEEYVGKIQSCCIGLAEKSREGQSLAYDEKEIPIEAVLVCAAQVELRSTLPSYYVVRTEDVITESFVFNPLDEEYHEQYEIKIGNRGYITWLTHWDSDMETIRHELESIVYEDDATIRLPFDMSETLIKMKKTNALDKVIHIGTGTGYEYKDYMLVEIHPNEFVHMPIIKGYCDKMSMIRSLYEGLLRMAIQHPDTCEEGIPSCIVAYNKYKSPIIEYYLNKEHINYEKYAIRQVRIEHIIRIYPDADAYLWNEDNAAVGIDYLYDRKGDAIEMTEFDDWAKEAYPIIVASETGQPYEKDWVDYHRRGLEMAQTLRNKLSTDFDLWYEAPWEDKSDIIEKPMLIIGNL